MTEAGPVLKGCIVWRKWWFSVVAETGVAVQLDGTWLCPVRYRNGEHGIAVAMPRMKMNGLMVTECHELRAESESDDAIRRSSGMPEIIRWSDPRCLIGFSESGEDFEVELVLTKDGRATSGRVTAVRH